MDRAAAVRVIELFERRGDLDPVGGGPTAAITCLDRAEDRRTAAQVLLDARLWETAFTTAYDAYRTAADVIVLSLGYRVPATRGAHRIAADVAHAALSPESEAFAPTSAERFRRGRNESEYYDPARPVDKTAADAAWAVDLASRAVASVREALLDD